MKNIIYQYWQGNLKPGVIYSTKLMKEYADSHVIINNEDNFIASDYFNLIDNKERA